MLFFYRLLIVVTVLSVGLTGPSPSKAADFQYLIGAANEIKQIEHSKVVLSQDDNGRIARIACDALTQVVEDPRVQKALQDILSPKNLMSLQSPAFALVENLKDFNAVFIPIELQKLRDAGLEYPAIFDSLQIASRERIRAQLKDISVGAVLNSLQTAKQIVCQMAQSIVTEQQRKAAQWTVGGATLIVVDVAGALGIASVSSGTLAVVGGAILIASITVGEQAVVNGAKGDVP